MPHCLLAIASVSGIPLMYRRSGNYQNLPYPLQAALNGSHKYAQSFGARLVSFECENSTTTWHNFDDSVTLILLGDRAGRPQDACHRRFTLQLVWESMLLAVGLGALTAVSAVQQLKRQLKACYRLIDRILLGLDQGPDLFCDVTGLPDVPSGPVSSKLQSMVEDVAERADSAYGCLLVAGRLAAATRSWRSLTGRELCLLQLYVRCSDPADSAQPPSAVCHTVYLPDKSPKVSFRLVVYRVTSVSCLCTLCGPSPSLPDLCSDISLVWTPSMLASLASIETSLSTPSLLLDPPGLDSAVVGFLVENLATHRCLGWTRASSERASPTESIASSAGSVAVDADSAATLSCAGSIAVDADSADTRRCTGSIAVDADSAATRRCTGSVAVDADSAATLICTGSVAVDADSAATLRCTGSVAVDADSAATRRCQLRLVYRRVVGSLLSPGPSHPTDCVCSSSASEHVTDWYELNRHSSCYVHTHRPHRILVLFQPKTSPFTMRHMTMAMLQTLTSGKNARL